MIPTFRQLDGNIEENIRAANSSLGKWYSSIRDVPINKFSVDDLCRACRQELFLDQILPWVIDKLQDNPIAGHSYDGELASAVAKIPNSFWKHAPNLAAELKKILKIALPRFDADVAAEVFIFIGK